ncbi:MULTISPECIES: ribonuclease Z [Aestuariibaculum]|uniref:Ribonuclease Z n=1 Tax=Aestuariibaculum lutulentum TaxID=2920935 RepID=A0ABS9RK48_9FLAO|nr:MULTISPECIES: ribonuclease Z [Aestuariibaculum]MCH4553341.1 ribonuclease Z [Aestuariibaculum lutulentum]MCR8667767.1 ribonuclease Z [Aestuariibaculum sp. M13]
MILDQDGNISIITQEKATLPELVKKIQALYPKFKNNNIIVVLSSLKSLGVQDIVEFLELSNTHRGAKQSFVIVTDKIALDETPDEIVVVPTTQEAYDIIEMEEMERDLGF